MSQTRRQSMIESITNVVVGFTINLLLNFTFFPLFGWHISWQQNLGLGAIYTVISILRSYALRRIYIRIHEQAKPAADDVHLGVGA